MIPLDLHPDRLFPADPATAALARELYETVRDLPIVSPHGHTDPRWYADNAPFPDPSSLFIVPDHYVFRMLYSQGIPLEALGVPRRDDDAGTPEHDPRAIWRLFARNYHLFRGTPTRLWLDHAFHTVFGIDERLTAESADRYFDRIAACLREDAFRPRALFERFNIEVIATTESPLDPLAHHRAIRESGWSGRVVTAYRPDPVVDPQFEGFAANVARFGELTGEDTATWTGYLAAHRARRAFFSRWVRHRPITATRPRAARPRRRRCQRLLDRALAGTIDADEAEPFRAQMLTEMARMSIDDGLVMQIHPGSFRNHNPRVYKRLRPRQGCGHSDAHRLRARSEAAAESSATSASLTIILFTLDESTYARELAPLAGHYPALKLGPPWWFHDSSEGCCAFASRRSKRRGSPTPSASTTTRARSCRFPRDTTVARVVCRFLATGVVEHRFGEDEARELAPALARDLAKAAYRL